MREDRIDNSSKRFNASIERRTWCKYTDSNLEKLEKEFHLLYKIWLELEENWYDPIDYEDLYRVYPLLDTTAALARKRLDNLSRYKIENKLERYRGYKVQIVEPSDNEEVENKEEYLYGDEYELINGQKKSILLSKVVSTFLHASSYRYVDTRKSLKQKKGFEIYVSISTDQRKQFINLKSYVNEIERFIKDEIEVKNERKKVGEKQ